MKLQYLGDSRDAFKWDLLHWLCTRAEPAFAWFPCRPLIRPFVAGLAAAPRSLERIAALGGLEDGHPLEVTVAQGDAFVEEGVRRASYWDWCHPERHAEVRWLLERLPESAAVAVYQHRPRRHRGGVAGL